MSGSDSKKPSTPKDEPAPAPATVPRAAFMPGMDAMIAQQLGMGGYGDPSAILAYINSIQTPMNMPVPGSPVPSTPSTGGGFGSGNGDGGAWRKRQRDVSPHFQQNFTRR